MSKKANMLAQETLQIISSGGYIYHEHSVLLPLKPQEYETVCVITPEFVKQCKERKDILLNGKIYGTATIKVINIDSFDACREMRLRNPLVLNFANALAPGGGFLNGAQSQEESLCRNSTLYASISSIKAQEMYRHNKMLHQPQDSDYMLLSPWVEIFRNGEGALLPQPYRAAVLTVPAVDLRRSRDLSQAMIDEIMTERIENILLAAIHFGHTELVLGAWGCGTFGHNASKVAQYFYEVLYQRGYEKYFKIILFAVLDRSNKKETYQAFQSLETNHQSLIGTLFRCRYTADLAEMVPYLNRIDHFVRGHQKDHPLRVMILSALLADQTDLSLEMVRKLLTAAAYHDAGRVNGKEDATHGAAGALWYRTHIGEDSIVEFLITYHCLDDAQAKEEIATFGFADVDTVWTLYCLLKDADCLDRVRFKYFGKGALDVRYLRMPFSKDFLPIAYRLFEDDVVEDVLKRIKNRTITEP